MAIHFIPLLLAKVVGKLAFKKAAVHHGAHAHHSLGRKIVKQGAKKAVNTAVDKATAPKEPQGGRTD
jgi:hypothetical protein